MTQDLLSPPAPVQKAPEIKIVEPPVSSSDFTEEEERELAELMDE